MIHRPRACASLVAVLTLLAAAAAAAARQEVEFVHEELPNGLDVLYAPLRQAPVVHVRVIYHVGSRDERPDRQGFAHMFEHMMFRGSAHVRPEEHMKLIGIVGGNSNAFTSFDQTAYVNTVPANHLEMALYLEADRMASFKVSEEIYKVERNVVAKEWGIRHNQPYGTLWEDFLRTAFTTHSYRWTPIGNMEHLRSAPVGELQDFFNRYYVPNNAALVIAGDIDVERTKALVRRYFGWIPKGPAVQRDVPAEPEQAEPRRTVVHRPVPLATVMIGYHTAPYASDDHYALEALAEILGGGRSGRLPRKMVSSADPVAVSAGAGNMQLYDRGLFTLSARLLPGKDLAAAEQALLEAAAEVVEKGVTEEELERAKTQARIAHLRGLETATQVAARLGEALVFGGDADRVNKDLDRFLTLKPADVRAVAAKYLRPQRGTTLHYVPDPTGRMARQAAAEVAAAVAAAGVAPATRPVEPRVVNFPEGYPARPPMADAAASPTFEKGTEIAVHGVRVIVMTDRRLPLVNWSLTMRRGGHGEPAGKDGLASLAASLLRRGVEGLTYEQLNADLESRGITVEAVDGGDFTRVGGSATSDQAEHGILRTRQVLLRPTFPADEFDKLKRQTLAGLTSALSNPASVADRELRLLLFGDTVLGRSATPQSVASITLDDVKAYYRRTYVPDGGAFLVFSGDVTVEQARPLAEKLLEGWRPAGDEAKVDYALPPAPEKRRILLVDHPDARQSVIQMGVRGYTVHDEDKYAGSLAGTMLSSGIDSRLGRYVRAEKGYAYGVRGYFMPGRQAGVFNAATETAFETTAAAIEAMFKVFGDLRSAPVGDEELREAQSRVAGSMVMQVQTIGQQASRRVDVILNGYPIDYYDRYPVRIAQVTPAQVQEVMRKHVRDDRFAIVVVAPADKVKEQLSKLGEVEVVPMPLKRPGAAAAPSPEMLRPQGAEKAEG